jgi:hypothetical protein
MCHLQWSTNFSCSIKNSEWDIQQIFKHTLQSLPKRKARCGNVNKLRTELARDLRFSPFERGGQGTSIPERQKIFLDLHGFSSGFSGKWWFLTQKESRKCCFCIWLRTRKHFFIDCWKPRISSINYLCGGSVLLEPPAVWLIWVGASRREPTLRLSVMLILVAIFILFAKLN